MNDKDKTDHPRDKFGNIIKAGDYVVYIALADARAEFYTGRVTGFNWQVIPTYPDGRWVARVITVDDHWGDSNPHIAETDTAQFVNKRGIINNYGRCVVIPPEQIPENYKELLRLYRPPKHSRSGRPLGSKNKDPKRSKTGRRTGIVKRPRETWSAYQLALAGTRPEPIPPEY